MSRDFEVAGVAVRGVNGSVDLKTAEFLCVAIEELKQLIPAV